MFNMYYIYGDEEFLIKEEISKIIKENPKCKIFNFNSETKFQDAINHISTFSLLDNQKLLIFNNFSFLEQATNDEWIIIQRSLKFKPETTIVIFTSNFIINNKKGSKNSFLNFLFENAKVIECKTLSDQQIQNFAREKINKMGGSISDIDLYYFFSKIPNKLLIVNNEIEKLIVLDKNISRSNIDDIVQKYDTNSAFDFINSFHDGNVEQLFKTYYDKINHGETIQNLISQIANVLELCSRIYSLKNANHSIKEIEEITKKHSFVIKKNIDFLNKIGYKKISDYLAFLSKIDYEIKIGKIEEKIGFERFLLEIIKN